jgi:hypothetical protein
MSKTIKNALHARHIVESFGLRDEQERWTSYQRSVAVSPVDSVQGPL